jgi:hypothetical protein
MGIRTNSYYSNQDDMGVAIIFLFFIFFIVFIVFGVFASFMDIAYAIDDKIQRYYHKHQLREAIEAYHDDMQRQLAISKTKVELLEMETKLKKLTTTT